MSEPSLSAVPMQRPSKLLDIFAKSWFLSALVGQWFFAVYIFVVYGLTLMNGLQISDFSPAQSAERLSSLDIALFFTHILPAVYLSIFGILQLVPAIRVNYKRFHRINGRLFLLLGFTGAITGLYLQWNKGNQAISAASLGITLNGLLIISAVFFAWRYALKKRFDLHQRWALHAFILVNGVWSFRLYLMAWYLINQGPNGNTANVDGPVDIALSFACYLVPMLLVELYLWGRRQSRQLAKVGVTICMAIGVLMTIIGVLAAASMMWTPRVEQVFTALGG